MTQPCWTVRTLKTALEQSPDLHPGELSVRVVEGADPVLLATMHEHGDLDVFVTVSDQEIAASVLLWPLDEQKNVDKFNDFLLRTQKLVPLSNFGITEVNGRDYYQLSGEIATTTPVDTVVVELRVLAENAIAAASDLRSSFNAAHAA